MSDRTKIEWADATWNPVTGCTPISPGCDRCYAQRYLRRRFRPWPLTPMFHPDRLGVPFRWRRGRVIFVCSLGDLFHEGITDIEIGAVYGAMKGAWWHTYMVLTKRPERMGRLLETYRSSDDYGHVWHGMTVESAEYIERAKTLRWRGRKFVSAEPLLGPLPGTAWMTNLDWLIVGGETGPGARPMEREWVESLAERAAARGIPFLLKSWGWRNGKPCRDPIPAEWRQWPGRLWSVHSRKRR